MSSAEHDEAALTEALAEEFRDSADDAYTIRAIARRYAEHYARQASGWISVADRLPATPHEDNGRYSEPVVVLRRTLGRLYPSDAWYVAPDERGPALWNSAEGGEIDAASVIAWTPYPDEGEMARLIERATK